MPVQTMNNVHASTCLIVTHYFIEPVLEPHNDRLARSNQNQFGFGFIHQFESREPLIFCLVFGRGGTSELVA